MKSKARKNKIDDEQSDYLCIVPKILEGKCKNDEISRMLKQFNSAVTIEVQIDIVHKLSSQLIKGPCEDTQLILTILMNLFVHSSPKSAIKRSLLRILIKAKKYNEFMATDLSQQLLEFINTVTQQQNDIKKYNDCVNSINDCFNNFSAGVTAITFIVKDVFDFLIQYLIILFDGLSNITSPIKLQEYYNLIHNNTRALVAVTQQCDNIESIIEEYMPVISEYCIKLFKNHEIFFDTKNNCSIILITAANYSENNGFKTILQIAFNEPVTKWNIDFENINNDITLICIFMGTLNTVEANKLCCYENSFKDSYIYKISEELFNMAKLSADKPSVVLGANRALALVSRSIHPLNNDNLLDLLNKFLDHVWTQLGHYVDSVRHVAKSILVNVIKISVGKANLGFHQPLDLMINSILNFETIKEQKYAATSILVAEIGCEILLSRKPDLVANLLPNSFTDPSQHCYIGASSCYETLMKKHIKETTLEKWFQTWVLPLMSKFQELIEVDDYAICLQNLMIMAITFQPKIIDALITDWCKLPLNIVKLNAILNSTLVIRRKGIGTLNTADDVNKWRGLLDYSILETAKCHSNDQIRITSLSLIADSHKTTEIFSEFEYEFVLSFFYYNISTYVPSTRQQILFLLKKILTRFSESYYAIIRDFTKINNDKTAPEQIACLKSQKQYYEQFILKLRSSAFDSLFPHANYSRRTICLEILTLIESICCEISKYSDSENNNIWKQCEVDAILNCLSDTYENNQILAVKILQTCPVELVKLQDTENTQTFIDNSLKLAISVKPADTQTAAYMFETCLISPVLQELLSCNDGITCKNYLLMKVIFASLQKQVEIGKNNLLKAASSNPMHGTLFCLRHLIENHLFVLNLNYPHWKTFIDDTIQICFDISDIAGPIVNSSSPEGHLPMDNYACSDANDEEIVTSQMLLVCSWRSIKEVSLVLGEIVLKSTIVGENEDGLITPEQIMKIGEHFITLLTETKHRGAFEQAYVGFSKLCTRLWQCKSQILHQLPVNWLFDIINAISGNNPKQNTKLCATRRSAGVPFMIQAIAASELQTGGSNHFHRCMSMLLKFADHPGDNVEMRTHSMNILRALYRHTQLGEDISPYIADGVVAAINGFTKKTWAERNAATVLFSSLMTRIFGVQRSKDSDKISIRNQMTTRVFFLRYPSLHNFLLNKLIELTDPNCNDIKFVALYSILLLLARLYPSNSDGQETDNLLQVFVPHVKQCAYNKDLQIRKLSAKALIPLVPNESKHILLKELFNNLQPKNTANYIHGTLLQIFYLLRTINETNNYTEFNLILKNSSWLIQCNGFDNCALITSLYMKILTFCLSKFEWLQKETKFLNHLLHTIFEQDQNIQNDCVIGKSTYFLNSTELSFYLAYYLGDLNLSEFILNNLQHKNEAVVEFTLNFLLHYLNSMENNISYIVGQFDVISVEENNNNLIELYKTYNIQILAGLKSQFNSLVVIINEVLIHKILTAKGLLVLSYFQHELIEEFKKYPGRLSAYWMFLKKSLNYAEKDDIACATIICMHKYLKNISLQDRLSMDFSEVFEKISFYASPDQFEICKYAIALMLTDEELNWLLINHEIIGIDNVFVNWHSIILLIMDEEAVIRETVSKLTRNQILPEKAKEELLNDFITITRSISEEKCLAYLLFWSILNLDILDSPDDLEMQIFEKNGTSLFVEDVHLNRLVAKSLKNIVTCETETDFINNLNRVIIILKKEQRGFVANNLFIELLEHLHKHILLQVQSHSENAFNLVKEFFVQSNINSVFKYKLINIVKYLGPSEIVWDNLSCY